jgi:hypothetical protein
MKEDFPVNLTVELPVIPIMETPGVPFISRWYPTF